MTVEMVHDPEELIVAAHAQVEAPRDIVEAADGKKLSNRFEDLAVSRGKPEGEVHGEIARAAAVGERANGLGQPGDVFGSEHTGIL
jgi:hypothetical protein